MINSAIIKYKKEIKTTAKALYIIFRLASLVTGLGMLLVLARRILTVWLPDLLAHSPFHLTLPDVSVISVDVGSSDSLLARFVAGMLALALVFAIFWLAGNVFRDISRSETPFLRLNARRLKIISVLLLVYTFIPPLVLGVFSLLLTNKSSVAFNLAGIVFSLIVYGLAYIFDYGQLLQTESDETL